MATYYVNNLHPSASDSNAGTSSSAPWLTLDKAASTVTTGPNTIYVAGGGIYRELVTLDGSGSAGNTIDWIADVDGEIWPGQVGGVTITASDNDTSDARANVLVVSSRSYHTFTGFAFMWGSTRTIGMVTTPATNMTFDKCLFKNNALNILDNVSGANNWILRRSVVDVNTATSAAFIAAGTQTYSNWLIELCYLVNCGWNSGAVTTSSVIRKNTFLGALSTIRLRNTGSSDGFDLLLYDNVFLNTWAVHVETGNAEGIIEDGNQSVGARSVAGGTVTQGANTITGIKPLFRMPRDLWGALLSLDISDDDAAATTEADFFSTPRLSGGPVDVGAIQKRRWSAVDVSGVTSLSVPALTVSPFFEVAVKAGEEYDVTCTVDAASAVTNQPELRVLPTHGVSNSPVVATDVANGPETLTMNVTPTATGRLKFYVANLDPSIAIICSGGKRSAPIP